MTSILLNLLTLCFTTPRPSRHHLRHHIWKGKLLTEDGWQAVTVDIYYDSLKVIDGGGNVVLAGKLRNPSTVARDQAIYLDLTVDNLNLSTRGDDLPFDYFVGVQEYDGVPTFEEIAQMQQDTSAQ